MSLFVVLVVVTPMKGQWEKMETTSLHKATNSKAKDIAEWAHKQRHLAHQIGLHGGLHKELEALRNGEKSLEDVAPLARQSMRHAKAHAGHVLAMLHLNHAGYPLYTVEDSTEILSHVDMQSQNMQVSAPFLYQGTYAILLSNPVLNYPGERLGTDILVVSLSPLESILGSNAVLACMQREELRLFWPPPGLPASRS